MPELKFVTAEEAAKWPEGVPVIARRIVARRPVYNSVNLFGPDTLRYWVERCKMTSFARLPDTLPELQKGEG